LANYGGISVFVELERDYDAVGLFQTREDESRVVGVRDEPRWTISDLYH